MSTTNRPTIAWLSLPDQKDNSELMAIQAHCSYLGANVFFRSGSNPNLDSDFGWGCVVMQMPDDPASPAFQEALAFIRSVTLSTNVPVVVYGNTVGQQASHQPRQLVYHAKVRHVADSARNAAEAAVVLVLPRAITPPLKQQSARTGASAQILTKPYVIGISGCTQSGKTSLAKSVCDRYGSRRCRVFACDDYFTRFGVSLAQTWDDPAAIDHTKLLSSALAQLSTLQKQFIENGSNQVDNRPILIIEGFMAFWDPMLVRLMDRMFWLESDRDVVRHRRMTEKPVTPEHFNTYLWPNFVMYEQKVIQVMKEKWGIIFIKGQGTKDQMLWQVIPQIENN